MMVGATIRGKYRLHRLLGEGGMGAVYEGEVLPGEAGAGGRVALKLMRPELLDYDAQSSLARFHREAKAASAIGSEHIVQVLDFGTDPDTEAPYLVMEMLAGEDLGQLLERVGRLRPEVALKIGAQACVALEKAHEARVMHRDIKPANLFLARGGAGQVVLKILDFGLAKIKRGPGELTSALTRSGSLLASPRYMSPEQARGDRRIDFRTDLWSLGMVLYHALTGHPAHSHAKTLADLILWLCSESPELHGDIPPGVAAVVHRALSLDPADRFPSATAMLEALRALLPGGWALDEGMLGPRRGEAGDRGASAGSEAYITTQVFTQDVTESIDVTVESLDGTESIEVTEGLDAMVESVDMTNPR